jgi:hypothetical protein
LIFMSRKPPVPGSVVGRLRVHDRERLQEIVDLVRRHGEPERVPLDARGALEVGDTIPVHHHPTEGGVRLHVAGGGGASVEEERREGETEG